MTAPVTLTRDQVRMVDRLAIERYGIPGVVLMENAGRNATDQCARLLMRRCVPVAGAKVVILCGGGNNGGDGYVIARHLAIRGADVRIVSMVGPDKLTGDAAVNASIAVRMNVPIAPLTDNDDRWHQADLLVDAMLGTGFRGEVREPIASAIRRCNDAHAAGALVLAADLPSGLDCDTGQPADPTIKADLTVTFVATKVGFLSPASHDYTGEVVVADIGAPVELIDRVRRNA